MSTHTHAPYSHCWCASDSCRKCFAISCGTTAGAIQFYAGKLLVPHLSSKFHHLRFFFGGWLTSREVSCTLTASTFTTIHYFWCLPIDWRLSMSGHDPFQSLDRPRWTSKPPLPRAFLASGITHQHRYCRFCQGIARHVPALRSPRCSFDSHVHRRILQILQTPSLPRQTVFSDGVMATKH